MQLSSLVIQREVSFDKTHINDNVHESLRVTSKKPSILSGVSKCEEFSASDNCWIITARRSG